MSLQKPSTSYTTPWGQTVLIQRKAGLKRLSMRFSKGAFLVSAPWRFPLKEIWDFIEGAYDWCSKVLNHQEAVTAKKSLVPGQTIQLLGNEVDIRFIESCKEEVILNGNILEVYGIRSRFEKQVLLYLRRLAQEKLSAYSQIHAKKLGVVITKITVKEMASRYGSCTSLGNLNYCWRIIFAPEPVLAYLCAHEVAHLKEMNHSQRFWNHVAALCPDYAAHRKWLKQHGKSLFSILAPV